MGNNEEIFNNTAKISAIIYWNIHNNLLIYSIVYCCFTVFLFRNAIYYFLGGNAMWGSYYRRGNDRPYGK